jgi:transporter family-2 protein
MLLFSLIPVIVGISMVLQNAMNNQISKTADLSSVLIFNCIVSLLASVAVFYLALLRPSWLPEIFHPKSNVPTSSWWIIIPGMCGFMIILGMPIALDKLGALKVLCVVIATQLVTALMWDTWIAKMAVTPQRILGALVTLMGAVISLFA